MSCVTLASEETAFPAIPLLAYTQKRFEKIHGTPTFKVALFTTVKTWKQSKCPSAEEWIF